MASYRSLKEDDDGEGGKRQSRFYVSSSQSELRRVEQGPSQLGPSPSVGGSGRGRRPNFQVGSSSTGSEDGQMPGPSTGGARGGRPSFTLGGSDSRSQAGSSRPGPSGGAGRGRIPPSYTASALVQDPQGQGLPTSPGLAASRYKQLEGGRIVPQVRHGHFRREGPHLPKRHRLQIDGFIQPPIQESHDGNVAWVKGNMVQKNGKLKEVMCRILQLNNLRAFDSQRHQAEVMLLGHLKHKYILPFYGKIEFGAQNPCWALVFELCKCSLRREIETRSAPREDGSEPKGPPSERLIKIWMGQIAQALMYIHGINVAHCRICPDSILIRGDHTAVLTRFTSYVPYAGPGVVGIYNNANYLSPEMIQHAMDNHSAFDNKKSDVWAFGCTIAYLSIGTGQDFFDPTEDPTVMLAQLAETEERIGTLPHEDVQEVVRLILDPDETNRPSAEQLLGNRFFYTSSPSSPHHVYGPPAPTTGKIEAPKGTFNQLGNTDGKEIREMEAQGFFIKNLIGKGAYGSVYAGVKREPDGTETPLAMKVIARLAQRSRYRTVDYPAELHFMESYHHPNIVELVAIFRERFVHRDFDRRAFIWMEQAVCDLSFKIKETNRRGLDEETTQKYLKHVVDGLNFLYDCNIAHRDLKPANILIANGDIAKLTDFSFTKEHDHAALSDEIVGTKPYMSPQLLLGFRNNPFKSDT